MGRPIGVALLAALALLIGIFEVLRPAFGFFLALVAFPLGFQVPSGELSLLNVIVGFIWILTAYTFWKGEEIGWYLGILMAIVVIVLDFPLGSVFGIIVLLYLTIPRGVRDWFSKKGTRNWIGA